ncbi:hypothetical protein HHI36_018029 [Cryptolaemus montrouzieri]|uniref:Uncharacterized protein n=1 Tax=Cryptolaemus montrouzieri TaxID=559131 RepID=A0ABD2NYR6_9CUCU
MINVSRAYIVQRSALLRDLDEVRKEDNDTSITESYVIKKISSNQNKAAYKIINSEFNLKSKSKYPTNFTDDENEIIGSREDAANAFNDYFMESIDELAGPSNPSSSIPQSRYNSSDSIFLKPLFESDTLNLIYASGRKRFCTLRWGF